MRDKQIREPIFIVGKDFIPRFNELRSGIVNASNNLLPYEVKGTSGIVPKHKINYTEIGLLAGVTKD